MSAWCLAIACWVLAGGAWGAARSPSPRAARGVATQAMALATALATVHAFSVLGGWGQWGGAGPSWLVGAQDAWGAWFPLNVCVVGLLAVGLSPVGEAKPKAMASILLTLAFALLAASLSDPLTLTWVASLAGLPVWWGLRAEAPGAARVFAWHQLPAALLLPAGAWLWLQGHLGLGAACLAVALVLRKGLFPGQAWVPQLVEHAPMGLSVAFLATHLSAFALLRVLPQGLPPSISFPVLVLGALTVLLSAALATVQRRPRRALAFLWLHQSACLVLGLLGPSGLAQTGALLAWLVEGLAMAGFAMALVALEARRGPLAMQSPAGCWKETPRLALAFLGLGLATVGIPGTVGFVADDLLYQGLASGNPLLGLSLVLGTALAGVAVARAFFLLFMGHASGWGPPDLRPREAIAFSGLFVVVFGLGLLPATVVHALADHLHPSLTPLSVPSWGTRIRPTTTRPHAPMPKATQHDNALPRIGQPATRALAAEGITTLSQLRTWPAAKLLALHGMGPKAIRLLNEALETKGLPHLD